MPLNGIDAEKPREHPGSREGDEHRADEPDRPPKASRAADESRRQPRVSYAQIARQQGIHRAVSRVTTQRDQRRLPLDLPARKKASRVAEETREELLGRLLDPELTLAETAKILEVCPATVRRYADRGVLPHHRTPGNQRRFKLRDVLAFLARADRSVIEDVGDEEVDAI